MNNPTTSILDRTAAITAAELREMADLLDLQEAGSIVRFVGDNAPDVIGHLTSVYFSDDSIAVNVHGLIDWSTEGKDYGRDFSCGPLYGSVIVPVPEADVHVGYTKGRAVRVFHSQAQAVEAVEADEVETYGPWTWHIAGHRPTPDPATTVQVVSSSPAEDWAWAEVASPNVDYDGGPYALVLLAFARLADEALNSPNGYGFTTVEDVAARIKMDANQVHAAAHALERSGLLVRRSFDGTPATVKMAYRVPEEAFKA